MRRQSPRREWNPLLLWFGGGLTTFLLVVAFGCEAATPDRIGIAPYYGWTETEADFGAEAEGDVYGLTVSAEWDLRPRRVLAVNRFDEPVDLPWTPVRLPETTEAETPEEPTTLDSWLLKGTGAAGGGGLLLWYLLTQRARRKEDPAEPTGG